jgi:hypothetical protein
MEQTSADTTARSQLIAFLAVCARWPPRSSLLCVTRQSRTKRPRLPGAVRQRAAPSYDLEHAARRRHAAPSRTASGHRPRAPARARLTSALLSCARSDGARYRREPDRQASPAAPQALAGPATSSLSPKARGAEETITRLRYEERSKTMACAKAHAFLSRDELEAAPGAALAYRRVRAAGAAARTRTLVHCKHRAGRAQLCLSRVIG